NANAGNDTSSSATTRVTRSRAPAIVIAPAAEASSRKWYSPVGRCPADAPPSTDTSASVDDVSGLAGSAAVQVAVADSSTTSAAPPAATSWKTSVVVSTTYEHASPAPLLSGAQNTDRVVPSSGRRSSSATTRPPSDSHVTKPRRMAVAGATTLATNAATAVSATTRGGPTASQSTGCTRLVTSRSPPHQQVDGGLGESQDRPRIQPEHQGQRHQRRPRPDLDGGHVANRRGRRPVAPPTQTSNEDEEVCRRQHRTEPGHHDEHDLGGTGECGVRLVGP